MEFSGELWHWRGPAPYVFVTVPDDASAEIHDIAGEVTYGWGMVPVRVRIGHTGWNTALFPKDGRYVVPLKGAVRHAEGLEVGDTVKVWLDVRGDLGRR